MVGIVGVVVACGIRRDEYMCENAVARLQSCCKGFGGSNIDCTYEPGSCDKDPVLPQIDETQASCVVQQSCDSLVSSGACGRAAAVITGGSASGVCR